MIRQIALALLALFLTLPAAAAPLCHQPPVAVAVDHAGMGHAAMGHDAPAPSDDEREVPPAMAKQHGCLGCAAPTTAATAIAMIALPPLAAPVAYIDPLDGIATAPVLPPPRP